MIYTPNALEGYNRQIRKVTQNKPVFPTDEAVRKAFYLAHRDIAVKCTMPIPNWPKILNQLVIYFEGRIQISPIYTNPLTVSWLLEAYLSARAGQP